MLQVIFHQLYFRSFMLYMTSIAYYGSYNRSFVLITKDLRSFLLNMLNPVWLLIQDKINPRNVTLSENCKVSPNRIGMLTAFVLRLFVKRTSLDLFTFIDSPFSTHYLCYSPLRRMSKSLAKHSELRPFSLNFFGRLSGPIRSIVYKLKI